jgi:hypothetical protein
LFTSTVVKQAYQDDHYRYYLPRTAQECPEVHMSVIHNTQNPESTLKKKSNSICYHYIRESVAMGEALTAHIRSEYNPADICTKLMPGGEKRNRIASSILYYYDYEGEEGSVPES